MIATLVRNWWMMAIRGVLAIGLGLCIFLWPNMTLGLAVVLFGTYALLDGAWAVAAAVRSADWPLESWAVVLEGVVSIALGGLALIWPFIPSRVLYLIAAWGIVTGVLEILGAVRLPREGAGHWFLGTAGVSSLFLALLILFLRHADRAGPIRAIGVYALVFGVLVCLAAIRFRRSFAIRARNRAP